LRNANKRLKKDCTATFPFADKKIKTVGLDYISADTYDAEGFPVHKILLGNGIAIIIRPQTPFTSCAVNIEC
jgi:kynurenine formamidase